MNDVSKEAGEQCRKNILDRALLTWLALFEGGLMPVGLLLLFSGPLTAAEFRGMELRT
jgi:hypothetical protein